MSAAVVALPSSQGDGVEADETLVQNYSYTYNDRNQLTRIDYGGGNFIEYEYDDVGNRTRRVVQFNLPEPVLTVADVRIVEGDHGSRWARFDVSLSGPSATTISVDYQTADGTATGGLDFSSASGTLTLAPGNVQNEILVEVLGDTAVESTESFYLDLSNIAGAMLGTSRALALIEDDDRSLLAQRGVGASHGVASQDFETFRDAWDSQAADDFTLTEPARLTRVRIPGFFSDGGGPVDGVTVIIYADSGGVPGAAVWSASGLEPEDPAGGTFLLDLPMSAQLEAGTYWLAIQAEMELSVGGQWYWSEQLIGTGGAFLWRNPGGGFDNGCTDWQAGTVCGTGENPALGFEIFGTHVPSLTIADAEALEGDSGSSNLLFTVSLSGAVDQSVTVSYATADATATAGLDYESRSGSLVIPAGEISAGFTVPILGDQVSEAHETFFVQLTGSSGAPIADPQALATIEDDDAPRLSIDDVVVQEGDAGSSQAIFTVSLAPVSAATVTVSYATAEETARSGDDFTATGGVLSFAPGAASATIAVDVLGDTLSEIDESFRVVLSDPVEALLQDGEGAAHILDDDALIDQTINTTGNGQTSQNFESGLDIYDSRAADDFILRQGATLDAVEVRGFFTENGGPVDSVEVTIYADAGGMPAASAVHSEVVVPVDPSNPDFVLPLATPVSLNQGTYWLTVVANMNVSTGGQWFWRRQTVQTGAAYYWQNPGDGFGNGCTSWSVASTSCGAPHPDLSFRLIGSRQPALFVDDLVLIESRDPAAIFTVSLSPASTVPVSVDFATAEDTAIDGDDFTGAAGSLSFAPGESQKTVLIPIADNGVAEPSEMFYLDLSGSVGAPIADGRGEALLTRELFAQLGASTSRGLTSQDFDAVNDAVDSQAADDLYLETDGVIERIEVEGFFSSLGGRTEVQGINVRLYADDGGSPAASPLFEALGVLPKDPAESDFFIELGAPWSVPAGGYWLSVEAQLDYAAGNRRWFWRQQAHGYGQPMVWRNPADGFGQGCADWTVATSCGVSDDLALGFRLLGTAQPSIFMGDIQVEPGDGGVTQASFELELFPASPNVVTVDFATEDGSAEAGSDYVAVSGQLSFAPGETRKQVMVDVIGSERFEVTEVFYLRLQGAVGATVVRDLATATISRTILGQRLEGTSTGVTSQDFETANDAFDSTAADDFTLQQRVTLERVEASGFFSVGQGPLGSVDVRIYADLGGRPAATPTYEVTDLMPQDPSSPDPVLVLPTPWTLDAGTYWIAIEANMDFSSHGRWFWRQVAAVSGSSLRWRNPADGFGTGCTSWTSFTSCSQGPAADLGFALFGEVEPGVFIEDISVLEGDGGGVSADVVVRVYPAAPDPVTLDYQTVDGTALDGLDYTAAQGSLSFAAFEGEKTVSVAITGDVLAESDESFLVQLSSVVGAPVADVVGEVTIIDDDEAAALSVLDAETGEAEVAPELSFSVRLSAPSAVAVSVDYQTAPGSATVGDYSSASGTLTFAPGELEKSIEVDVFDDVDAEWTETLRLLLSNAAGAPIDRGEAVGTIFDDDAVVEQFGERGLFAVASQDFESLYDGFDAQAADRFRLDRSTRIESVEVDGEIGGFDGEPPALAAMDLWIYGAALDGPAVYEALALAPVANGDGRLILPLATPSTLPPGDYWLSVRARLDLGEGRWSWRGHERGQETAGGFSWRNPLDSFGTGCVAWTSGEQCYPEATSGLGFRVLGTELPALSVEPVEVTEGNTGTAQAVFTVRLSHATTETVTVSYTTLDGTAEAGEDYQATSGQLTLPAGTLQASITVPILGDQLDEPFDDTLGQQETFLLRLENASAAVFAGDSAVDGAVGVIIDDDSPPIVDVADTDVTEGTGGQTLMVFSLTLSQASAKAIELTVATADGTATAGDYLPLQEQVLFAPGETTAEVLITVLADALPEQDESFLLLLSDAKNVTLGDSDATGSILDDDDAAGFIFADDFESGDVSAWTIAIP